MRVWEWAVGRSKLSIDVVSLIVVESDISTGTEECAYINQTVRVESTEEVAQIESEVESRSYILVLPLV